MEVEQFARLLERRLEIKACPVEKFGVSSTTQHPLIRKERE
jgi:hypothetical protein